MYDFNLFNIYCRYRTLFHGKLIWKSEKTGFWFSQRSQCTTFCGIKNNYSVWLLNNFCFQIKMDNVKSSVINFSLNLLLIWKKIQMFLKRCLLSFLIPEFYKNKFNICMMHFVGFIFCIMNFCLNVFEKFVTFIEYYKNLLKTIDYIKQVKKTC